VTHSIKADWHPNGLAWDEKADRLYTANNNRDSVTVIDTKTNRPLNTIKIQPFVKEASGVAPTAVILNADGSKLYVACGGINAVVVIDTKSGKQDGMIPSGWYPNSLALSPDGRYLAIGSLLGAGSGWQNEPRRRFVHANRGSVNVVDIPDAAQLARYTVAVAENNRLPLAGSALATAVRPPSKTPKAVPMQPTDASLIEHVVYIVKENRTYDQLFGDLEKGNGEPSFVMFGEDTTPNHRKLAREFVLLDNFYASGGNSADGHQWVTQANEVAYTMWPGYQGRSYPFDGSDPIGIAQGGTIWDAALARKRTVRIYGEYAGRLAEPSKMRMQHLEGWRRGDDFTNKFNTVAPIAHMNAILAKNYPSYSTAVPDVVRAQIFLKDFAEWNREGGKMPNLTILQLPSDHTLGTAPGVSSPKAMVADNDLALGLIVEALSKSRYWSKMAIFVVEDDAQNGVDHVDGHRTVALAISPYIRRGHVDSTFYSNQSMLKTMELMMGLGPLSMFDLIANDMRASFQDTADLKPYEHVKPQQDLFAVNPPASALKGEARKAALASAKMRWDIPDAAPTEKVNRILWAAIKGAHIPYPTVKQAVFAPYSLDIDDDDR
jgi:YVTN family beta-propeller protein